MINERSRKAQFQISFGMIFSIILIAVFIVVAIIAINAFLKISCTASNGQFIDELRKKVERIWVESGQDVLFESSLGNGVGNSCKIEEVCFLIYDEDQKGKFKEEYEDFSNFGLNSEDNLYFYPQKKADLKSVKINYVNMESFSENPYCIKAENGKVKMRLSKDQFSGETLVKIKRN
ncbi:hypothetical protein HYW74_00730 [Candidatus Pacearchaeota archaeon]|nr:hypothetical protein [Candidatus Pacearchaeota archaeon]